MGNEMVHQPNGGAVAAPASAKDLMPAVEQVQASLMESVLISGDLAPLKPTERMQYYRSVCASLGLNPLTKPFEYLQLDNRLVLYVKRDGTDQLASLKRLTRRIVGRELVDNVYVVTAHAKTPDGREEESIGAVPLVREIGEWKSSQSGKRFFQGTGKYEPLKPDERANAMMKAETKAKRRVTLSICGLGFVDESELDTMPNARRISMEQAHTLASIPVATDAPVVQHSAQAAPAAQPKSESQKKGETSENTTTGRETKGADDPRNDTAPLTEEEQLAKRWATADTYERLRMFGELKKDLHEVTGDDAEYYRILLDKGGVDHANQFKIRAKAWVTLIALFRSLKAHTAAVTIEPPDSMSAEEFVEGLEPAGAAQ